MQGVATQESACTTSERLARAPGSPQQCRHVGSPPQAGAGTGSGSARSPRPARRSRRPGTAARTCSGQLAPPPARAGAGAVGGALGTTGPGLHEHKWMERESRVTVTSAGSGTMARPGGQRKEEVGECSPRSSLPIRSQMAAAGIRSSEGPLDLPVLMPFEGRLGSQPGEEGSPQSLPQSLAHPCPPALLIPRSGVWRGRRDRPWRWGWVRAGVGVGCWGNAASPSTLQEELSIPTPSLSDCLSALHTPFGS